MVQSITLLGSTGSIGRQTLDVCRNLNIRVEALSFGRNIELATEQIREFRPSRVCVANGEEVKILQSRFSELTIEWLYGDEGLTEIAKSKCDRLVLAITGFASFRPLIAAIQAGRDIAMANKEAIVTAGRMIMQMAHKAGVTIYPVDSEHSAIWQCIQSAPPGSVEQIYLTASGGPFRGKTRAELEKVSVQDALAHPLWAMGSKISIDSATLMNKGLELIEGMHLFDLPEEKVKVLVHPQGIVHSMVEFKDGEILAQLGTADMRLPIQLALTWPERVANPVPRFDFLKEGMGKLEFEAPDLDNFPALRLAREAARVGGFAPCILNAANEVAVRYFLAGKLPFVKIAELSEICLESFCPGRALTEDSFNDIIEVDREVRLFAERRLMGDERTVK